MYKFALILILLSLFLPFSASAFLDGPIVPCGIKSDASRSGPCDLCHIFEMGKNIIDFIIELLFVIAPIFVLAGGITILTSGGKPDQVGVGKKIISSAIVGILIALLAWTVLSVLFNALVGDEFPWPWNEVQCKIDKTTKVIPSDPPEEGEWCTRSAPFGSNKWKLSGIDLRQKGDASPQLASFLNCMYDDVSNLIITSISSDIVCNDLSCDTLQTGCGHTANSCHFGGTNCTGQSYAVDLATNVECSELEEAAQKCDPSAWINWEGNHLHISVNNIACGCNERQSGNACP